MSEIVVGIIAGSIVAIISFVLGLFGNMWYGNYQEKKRIRKNRLIIHFNDIKELLDKQILLMAKSFQFKNGRLMFGGLTSVYESYDFEEIGIYTSFKLHFPELEQEWKQLNENAVKLRENLKGSNNDNSLEYKILRTNYIDFYWRLKITIENIEKYGIGSEFKKLNKCPICKQF